MCSIGKSSLKSINGQPFHSCHSYVQWQGTKSRLNHRRSIQAIFHLDEDGMTASSNGADSKPSENHGKMQVSWNMFTGFMAKSNENPRENPRETQRGVYPRDMEKKTWDQKYLRDQNKC